MVCYTRLALRTQAPVTGSRLVVPAVEDIVVVAAEDIAAAVAAGIQVAALKGTAVAVVQSPGRPRVAMREACRKCARGMSSRRKVIVEGSKVMQKEQSNQKKSALT